MMSEDGNILLDHHHHHHSNKCGKDTAIIVNDNDNNMMMVVMDAAKELHSHKTRKRKKQTYNAIREQMHFYFSDANLAKDRFLKQLISENSNVPLDVFMTFNRIKKLAKSTKDIETSILSSDVLELSEDRKSVRRITEIKERTNVDEYTIYVEALPTTATHDWLRTVFRAYGPIAYVSLPKYRNSGQIKEFAFVEFENHSSVQKCVAAFKQIDSYLGVDTNPANLFSIVTYDKERQQEGDDDDYDDEEDDGRDNMTNLRHNLFTGDDTEKDLLSNLNEQSAATTYMPEAMGDLTDASDVDSVQYDGIGGGDDVACSGARKKVKLMDKAIRNEDEDDDDDDDNDDDDDDDNNAVEDEVTERDELIGSSKKKTRRKRSAAKLQLKIREKESLESAINTLRITTKLEWKQLRNKYLNLQRQQMKAAKAHLMIERRKCRPLSAAISKNKPKKKILPNPRNINFYGANRDDSNKGDSENFDSVQPMIVQPIEQRRKPLFSYEPGIIVKILFDIPCVDVKDFKTEMRQYPFVKYVDVKEGDMAAYIRVDTPRSAPTLIKHCAPHRCQILTNETAEAYWVKINRDREEKLSKTLKVRAKRGREKINKQVSTHIRFED